MGRLQRYVQLLCDEWGHMAVLDSVKVTVDDHLQALQAKVDDIPSRSPNEQEEYDIRYVDAPSITEALKKEGLPSCTKVSNTVTSPAMIHVGQSTYRRENEP